VSGYEARRELISAELPVGEAFGSASSSICYSYDNYNRRRR